MSYFTRNGYARVYCENESDVRKVEGIMKALNDEYEEVTLFPEGIVAPFSRYPELIFVEQYDKLSKEYLAAACWAHGVKVWILDNCRKPTIGKPYLREW